MHAPFIHLRSHSAYSLLEGAMTVKKMVDYAAMQRMPALAITDTHNLFGSLEFTQACFKAGVQPIIGCHFAHIPYDASPSRPYERDYLLLLAKDEQGYQNLMRLSSDSYLHPQQGQEPLVSLDYIAEYSQGLIALTGGVYGALGKALMRNQHDKAEKIIRTLHDSFGDRLYIELMRHGLAEEQQIEPALLQLALAHDVPIVATNDAYFLKKEMYDAHDALMCIAEGRYVMEQDRRRVTAEHRLKSAEEMCALFADLPEAIDNTLIIAQRCTAYSPARKPILPSFHMEQDGVVLSEEDALRTRAREGLEARLVRHVFTDAMSAQERETIAKPYRDRLDFELNVIIGMGFPGYFLIVSDFITWSKEQNIPVGPGRGSGAASVVAWSLLITDLDPLKYDLVFERFLNPERVSMPDFDIDFCQDRRDEVIRYVQQKYGMDRVAQIITFGKLQARAVLRDVGRVLQMPYGQVDRICKLVPSNPANPVTLAQAIEIEPLLKQQMQEDDTVARLVEISLQLEGLFRHASTHAAGVVIGDRPLHELVALYRDPKSDMPVVQYSMKYAEEAGLVKFDFLGLKTLTVLAKALALLKKRGIEIDLSCIPLDDAKTFDLLKAGKAIGVFQFESTGMRDALRKLQPDRLEDLIALGALYRPGPMDNIPTYIACKHGKEQPDYLHPSLKPVLEETYGVIIYQEQVQKIAQILSGYTLGGADLLRRAMGKKIKEEMDAQRKIFVDGALNNNVDGKQANEIFDLVAKFAGYGFNKAHAAAYALIGYQTAYLKANYPVEFFAASMTYDMHNTDKLSIFKQDAESMGIVVLPPDLNRSEVEFSVEDHHSALAVRYALAAVKNVGAAAMHELVEERGRSGAYQGIFDFISRSSAKLLNKRQLEHLFMAGVCDSIHTNRHQLFASMDTLLSYGQLVTEERNSTQTSLFGEHTVEVRHPDLVQVSEWKALEKLDQEYKAIGFYLSAHPLDGYAPALEMLRVRNLESIKPLLNSEYSRHKIAAIVMGKNIRNSARGKFAFVQLSDSSGAYEASIFNDGLLNEVRPLLEIGTLVMLNVEAKIEEAGARLIIQEMRLLDDVLKSTEGRVQGGNLTLRIYDHSAVEQIHALLQHPHPQGTKITMCALMQDGRTAHIALKHNYRLSPEAMISVQQVQGCEVVK
ncbi:MAG: DNA polymerase III subunit alpha [Alphaproteobacteria bacterium]|nr:MAG: DNA polymerase III subunit alpha [Alphaproteobacteria bacterium]TAF75755.1 MAG: DNA polymerase III subunit alpha [Alphaproteobacteria bacterium]